jgi:hypothetical protein
LIRPARHSGERRNPDEKQFNRRWTPMDADEQGIYLGLAYGDAVQRAQETKPN